MNARKSLSPKLRFEIFKRDKFTCQYCGRPAPEVVLQIDHIQPVVQGGKNDALNLVTSCTTCNGGKGGVPLSDGSAISKQTAMLAELEERRSQIELMVRWRDELQAIQRDGVDEVASRFADRTGRALTEKGRADVRKWLKTSSLADLLHAMDEALDTYGDYTVEGITPASAQLAFTKIGGVARTIRMAAEKPYLRRLFYIQGILRRTTEQDDLVCLELLEHIHLAGESLDDLEREAKTIRYPSHLLSFYANWLRSVGRPYLGTDGGFTYRTSYGRRG